MRLPVFIGDLLRLVLLLFDSVSSLVLESVLVHFGVGEIKVNLFIFWRYPIKVKVIVITVKMIVVIRICTLHLSHIVKRNWIGVPLSLPLRGLVGMDILWHTAAQEAVRVITF